MIVNTGIFTMFYLNDFNKLENSKNNNEIKQLYQNYRNIVFRELFIFIAEFLPKKLEYRSRVPIIKVEREAL